ncbi:MAG: MFS transporter [Clostridiales bacterium]|jgi:Na+/melibiose symporter-like transporter|nr:MFS transporter [Clostridiales bacterium]
MKINFSSLKQKASDFFTDFREYWTKPPKGKYLSYKEIGAYSLGGMGQMLIGMLVGYTGLSAGNVLVGSIMGLRPVDLQLMNNILGFLGIFFVIVRGILVDNTRTRWGRFRPYIAVMGIPLVVLTIMFMSMDFRPMEYSEKLFWAFLFALATGFIGPLMNDTYNDLRTIMSPSTQERSFLIAVSSLVAGIAPTITNLFVPILVQDLGGGYTDLATLKAVFFPIGIIGLFFMLFTAFGTRERIFVSKQFKPKIRVFHAMGQVYRNKYWWIRYIAGMTGFLEGGIGGLYMWIFIYQIQNGVVMSAVQTVMGLASTVAMLTTPFILKKIGPRNLMIVQNFLNIVFISLMSMTFNIMWAGIPFFFFIFNFLSTVVYQLNIVADPVIHAEVKDFSHYQSGRRMDFMFGSAGIISFPITFLTGLVLPQIQESAGLTTNYNVLFDPAVRNTIFATLCIVSVIGSVLNLIPYFLYDFSETQHRNIIKVLRLRNLFEDYTGGNMSPRDIKSVVEEVNEARKFIDQKKENITPYTEKLKAAKAIPDKAARKAAVKEARHALSEAKALNENIAAAPLVMKDLKKYESGIEYEKLMLARETVALGFEGIKNIDDGILKQAKAADKKGLTEDEQVFRRYKIRRAKLLLVLKKAILEKNLQEMDTSELDAAQNMPETTRKEMMTKLRAIGAAQKKLNAYYLSAEAYMDAQAVIKDADAYAHFPDIEAAYEKACLEAAENERIEQEKYEAAKQAKREDLERIRREKQEKRAKKGGK